jgi:hypothetical protein
MDPSAAQRRRERAAQKYRPQEVHLLLVAEAPPTSLDRYFYFEDVQEQDSLFRYVVQTVLSEPPSRTEKAEQLGRLCERGVFLIDLKPDPKLGDEHLDPYVEDLVSRAVDLRPEHVITIKANVCDLCQEPLRAAGLDVVSERVPFPGSGQQRRFVQGMSRALASIDWVT